ncbi:unnamed protein product [Camellia sinensis]
MTLVAIYLLPPYLPQWMYSYIQLYLYIYTFPSMLPSLPSSFTSSPSLSLSLALSKIQAMHSGEDCEELYSLPPNPSQPLYTLSHAYQNNPSTSNHQKMKSTEIFTTHTTLPPPNPTQDPSHFSTFYINTSFPDYHTYPLPHEPSSNTSSYSNNSNSMVATLGKEGMAGELRRKRLVSN